VNIASRVICFFVCVCVCVCVSSMLCVCVYICQMKSRKLTEVFRVFDVDVENPLEPVFRMIFALKNVTEELQSFLFGYTGGVSTLAEISKER
jgi:hypothetical protein